MKRMKEKKNGSVHPSETGLYLFHTISIFQIENSRAETLFRPPSRLKPMKTNEKAQIRVVQNWDTLM